MGKSLNRITNTRKHRYQRGDCTIIVDGPASCCGLVPFAFSVEVRRGKTTTPPIQVNAFYAWDAVNRASEKIAENICKLRKS